MQATPLLLTKEDCEYVGAAQLAQMTGFSQRYFLKLAAEKNPDWAIQPGGPGTSWRFNIHGFKSWWDKGKAVKWQGASTRGAKRGGRGSRTAAKNTGSPLRQRLNELRAKGL